MPFETIQLGTAPAGDGGDTNRAAFTRINTNVASLVSRGLDEYMPADMQSVSVLAGWPNGKYYFATSCTDLPPGNSGVYVEYTKRYFKSTPSEYVVEAVTNHIPPRKFINRTNAGVWAGWTEVAMVDTVAGPWLPLTLLNGYYNYGSSFASAAYRKTALGYELQGLIRVPAEGASASTPAFNLPATAAAHIFVCPSFLSVGVWEYLKSGVVQPRTMMRAGDWVSLSGILLPA
ncbi:hypothetical protein [Pseudomonas nitroreducens]|uniref:hypothetical protein n=1 Tax=Pseudomonas nitroreducens TaxID=46680 RepID=UPI00265857A8|nr:hypothetical protein [Pseudomonas nitroreducens]MCP1652738.1 hypothetical protein [Pseudomonas nitroreducens]